MNVMNPIMNIVIPQEEWPDAQWQDFASTTIEHLENQVVELAFFDSDMVENRWSANGELPVHSRKCTLKPELVDQIIQSPCRTKVTAWDTARDEWVTILVKNLIRLTYWTKDDNAIY